MDPERKPIKDMTFAEWAGWKNEGKQGKSVENKPNTVYYKGAVYGALNDDNDPGRAKRDAHAERYYELVRKSDKNLYIKSISKNAGVNVEVVEKAYKHVFEDKHMLDTGYRHFDADYDMAVSLQRMRTNHGIQPHDRILLYHEALESDIMMENPGMSYYEAHKIANQTYNYQKALDDDHDGVK